MKYKNTFKHLLNEERSYDRYIKSTNKFHQWSFSKKGLFQILNFYHEDGYYVSFRNNPDHVGINIKNKYGTPHGFYCYPIVDLFESGYVDEEEINIPFAGDRPYLFILKAKPSKNPLRLSAYIYKDLSVDIAKLREWFDLDDEHISDIKETAKIETPAGYLWNITRVCANGNPVKWNSILRRLGYDYVIDSGESIIHDNEPHQAVFLSSSSFDLIDIQKNHSSFEKNRIINIIKNDDVAEFKLYADYDSGDEADELTLISNIFKFNSKNILRFFMEQVICVGDERRFDEDLLGIVFFYFKRDSISNDIKKSTVDIIEDLANHNKNLLNRIFKVVIYQDNLYAAFRLLKNKSILDGIGGFNRIIENKYLFNTMTRYGAKNVFRFILDECDINSDFIITIVMSLMGNDNSLDLLEANKIIEELFKSNRIVKLNKSDCIKIIEIVLKHMHSKLFTIAISKIFDRVDIFKPEYFDNKMVANILKNIPYIVTDTYIPDGLNNWLFNHAKHIKIDCGIMNENPVISSSDYANIMALMYNEDRIIGKENRENLNNMFDVFSKYKFIYSGVSLAVEYAKKIGDIK